jgi:hypothetical protein
MLIRIIKPIEGKGMAFRRFPFVGDSPTPDRFDKWYM